MPERWGTLSDNWGDVLCCLGFWRERVGDGGGVIYEGKYPEIARFLQTQPWIGDVRFLEVDRDTKQRHYENEMTAVRVRQDYMQWVCQQTGIPRERIERTHLCHEIVNSETLRWWHGASLPKDVTAWADEKVKEFWSPFLLVQPYSFASNSYNRHWPHWMDLLHYLADFHNIPVVVIGDRWPPLRELEAELPTNSHIYNLVGRCPSNMHVFALAQRAMGLLTTSNSLAHWANVQNIPQVIVCNRTSSDLAYFFRRILEHPQANIFHVDADIDDVKMALFERFFATV